MLSLLVATTLVMFMFAPAALGQQCFGGSQGIPAGAGVALSQVTWSFDGASGDGVSGTGQVDVNVPMLIAYTQQQGNGLSNGFINIVTTDALGNTQWVVENLPILPGYPYADISTMFYLNDGTAIQAMNAGVCYSQDPLTEAPSLQLSAFSVGSAEFDAGGKGGEVAAAPPPPPFNIVFPNPFGVFKFAFQANHPNVQTAVNQCAPASMANNFTWLKTTFGTAIPDPNNLGLRNTVANSLVGKLDMTHWSDPTLKSAKRPYCGTVAGRAAKSRLDGCAVNSLWWLKGYMTYLNGNNIALTLKHQGNDGVGFVGANNVTVGALTSTGQGNIVQPDFIYNEILNNSAVEYGDEHAPAVGGGHAMDVIAAGSVLGAPFIFYVSDHKQKNDNDGTQYIDASFLCQPGVTSFGTCNPDATKAPVVLFGDEDGSKVDTVFTQHP
jgi:hypothetical protein